jgi:uncharacterized membrane protein
MSRQWAEVIFLAANAFGWVAGSACVAASGFLVYASRKPDAPALLERTAGRLSRAAHLPLALAVASCGAAAAIKLAAWGLFQQTYDSTVSLQLAWSFSHGRGVAGSVFAPTLLAYHFSFLSPLISPLLRVWQSPGAFALAHGLAVGAIVPGVYLLAREYSPRSSVPVLAALLAFSHPLYQSLTQTLIEDSVFAPALFIWCVYFWKSGRRTPAVVLGLLFLAAKEEAPLVFVGLGIFGLVEDRKDRRPAALIAAAILVWFAQMRVIQHYRVPAIDDSCTNVWGYLSAFGNSSGTVIAGILREPRRFVFQVVWPPQRWGTAVRMLAYAGFAPLLSGGALLPAAIPWVFHQIAEPRSPFHQLGGYYGAFIFGPLAWSASIGLARAERRLQGPSKRLLAALVFAAAGAGLLNGAGYYRPRLLPGAWRESVPRALALIGPNDKVWADGYLGPQLAFRPSIKGLPGRLPNCEFELGLFMPDAVLFSEYWVAVSDPETVRRIFSFLEKNGFETVFRDGDLVLLKRPRSRPSAATGGGVVLP